MRAASLSVRTLSARRRPSNPLRNLCTSQAARQRWQVQIEPMRRCERPGRLRVPCFFPGLSRNRLITRRPVTTSKVSCLVADRPFFDFALPSNGHPTAVPLTKPENEWLLLRMISLDVSTTAAPCRYALSSISSARSNCVWSSTSYVCNGMQSVTAQWRNQPGRRHGQHH